MDGIERQLVEDIKSELVLSKREARRLSEKLDCLLILLRGAWVGESESIHKISEILGLPTPKIIPTSEEESMNSVLGQEYLQLTSSLLDEQLKDDASIKEATKVLRPSSAKHTRAGNTNQRRIRSSRKNTDKLAQGSAAGVSQKNDGHDSLLMRQSPIRHSQSPTKAAESTEVKSSIDDIGLLSDILPMFSDLNREKAPSQTGGVVRSQSPTKGGEHQNYASKQNSLDLFSPDKVIGPRKARPVSAALQQRQDYVRSQAKRKPRPQTAKPAFRHVTDLEFDTIIRANRGQPSPVSSPENKESLQVYPVEREASPSISVNILPKALPKKKPATADRNLFPRERDDQALGDVSDALQRVQEMERLFRSNTRRLQQKIGIPDAGFI